MMSYRLPTSFGLVPIAAICLSGCALIIGTLPPPDPPWAAVIDYRTEHGSIRWFQQSTFTREQAEADTRARNFVARFLPATAEEFEHDLRQQHFFCQKFYEPPGTAVHAVRCGYSWARAPVPCVASLAVTIDVQFPYDPVQVPKQWIEPKDLDVTAAITSGGQDDRGCFPM
jgi:hypothetical protein